MSRPSRPSPPCRPRAVGLRGFAASLLAAALVALVGLAPAQAETTGPVLDEQFAARIGEGFGERFPGEIGDGEGPRVHDVVPMPDGGFVVGGVFTTYQGERAPGLARLTPDLELDPDFMQRLGTGFTRGGVHAVVPMPDGGFVVGLGITGSYQGMSLKGLARLTPGLELDASFAADLGAGLGYRGAVHDVVPMPDGGFVLAGTFVEFQGQPTPGRVVRVDDRLQVDEAFAAALGAGFGGDSVEAVAALPDGGWLVGGQLRRYQGQPVSALVRLSAQLELVADDAPAPVSGGVRGITVLPDGGAIVTGPFTAYGGVATGGVIRLTPTMHLAEDLLPGVATPRRVALTALPTADGHYLVGGYSDLTVHGATVPGLGRFVSATVALAPVPDQTGYAGLPGAPVHLAATRTPATVPGPTYSATGLPAGVTLDAATGRISGTPTTAGTYAVELAAHVRSVTDVVTATWEVLPSAAPELSGEPTGAVVGTHYQFQPALTGAPAPTVAVRDGALPDGLTLDASTGLVSGTPTTPGTFRFTLAATNGIGPDAAVEVAIEVLGPPTVAVARPEVVAGQQQTVTGSGFAPGEPVAFQMASEPVDLGTVTATAAGAIALTFTVPAGTPPGAHTVTATGRVGAAVATFTVVEEAVVAELPAGAPTEGPGGALAVTGDAVGVVVGAAGLLLAVGLALTLGVGSARRRTARG